jgi:small conductance mechanosensitive channel
MQLLNEVDRIIPPGPIRQVASALAVILAAWIAYMILRGLAGRLERRAVERAGDEAARERTASAFDLIRGIIKAIVFLFMGLGLLHVVNIRLATAWLTFGRSLVTILVAWVAFQLVKGAINNATQRSAATVEQTGQRQRINTLLLLLRNVAKYIIIFFAGITVLKNLGVDLTPILAGAGILGLAIGFGSQNLVKDIVTGFFIIMEGQYAVGDSVEINGLFGRVEQVGLRITKIRDANGQLRFISNGTISRVNNYTANYIAHTINVPFSHDEPGDPAAAVRPILDDFDREFQVFAGAPTVGTVESLPTYARILKVETRSIPGRQSILESKLPARLKAGLERAGHAVPAGTEISVALSYPGPGAEG